MRGFDPHPRLALKLHRLRRHFGGGAPQVAIRPAWPWYARAFAVAVLLVVILLLGSWVYDVGAGLAGFNRQAMAEEVAEFRERAARQAVEIERLRQEIGASEGAVQIERAARQKLEQRVNALEGENIRLREDLAVFENLAKANAKPLELKGRR